MPRQKKSRKVGQIGTPKTSSNVRKPTEKRLKKPKGKPAGSRNSELVNTSYSGGVKVTKDPRHGSKKPIELIAVENGDKITSKPKVKHFSPAQELAQIEQDQTFSDLLEKLGLGKNLTREEQKYVDGKLARHKVLCEMLGLTDEPEEVQNADITASTYYHELDALNIDDFKD